MKDIPDHRGDNGKMGCDGCSYALYVRHAVVSSAVRGEPSVPGDVS